MTCSSVRSTGSANLDKPGRAHGCPQRVGEPGVGHCARRRVGGLPVAVRAWGNLRAVLRQRPADRLDPETAGTHLVNESADQRWRGSVKVGPGRGDSRWDCSVFPGRFPNPACTFQCTGLSTRPGQAAVVVSSSVSGQGEGMTAPR
jgi:hypothetical protein